MSLSLKEESLLRKNIQRQIVDQRPVKSKSDKRCDWLIVYVKWPYRNIFKQQNNIDVPMKFIVWGEYRSEEIARKAMTSVRCSWSRLFVVHRDVFEGYYKDLRF